MSNKLRWLLVGAGDIADKRVLPALQDEPRSVVTAVCDRTQAKAEALAARCGARAVTDFEAALAAPDIDAVYLCTPVHLHTPHAIAALQAGKHVLVEKPPARTYAEALELVAAAEASDRQCGVAYFRRFAPRYEHAQQMLRDGEFGQVVLLRLTYFSWFNPDPSDPKYWRVVPELGGGGPIADMGTHMFDVLIGLLGLPASIYAKVGTLTHDYAVEDSCVALLTMPDGAQGVVSLHWNSQTWSHEFELVGTAAKVKWHPYDAGPVVKTVGRDIEQLALPNPTNVHYPLVEDFVSACLTGRPPRVTAAEAAKTNLLIDALYESARTGREVALGVAV